MRIYSSESIGKILEEMKSGKRPSLFTELKRQEELHEAWGRLGDLRLRRIMPHFTIDEAEKRLSLGCASPTELSLVRRERQRIEAELRPLMERYGLTHLSISLAAPSDRR